MAEERVFEYDGVRTMDLFRELIMFGDTSIKDLSLIRVSDGKEPTTDEMANMIMHNHTSEKESLRKERFIVKFTPTGDDDNPLYKVETDSDVDWLIYTYAKLMDESITGHFRRLLTQYGWADWIDLGCEDCGATSFQVKGIKSADKEDWKPTNVAVVVCSACGESRAELGRYEKLNIEKNIVKSKA